MSNLKNPDIRLMNISKELKTVFTQLIKEMNDLSVSEIIELYFYFAYLFVEKSQRVKEKINDSLSSESIRFYESSMKNIHGKNDYPLQIIKEFIEVDVYYQTRKEKISFNIIFPVYLIKNYYKEYESYINESSKMKNQNPTNTLKTKVFVSNLKKHSLFERL